MKLKYSPRKQHKEMENQKGKKVRKPEDQIKRSSIQTIGIPERENEGYNWKELWMK